MTLYPAQIAALVAAGVRFVVVGGVAANMHGSVHVTFDLDICYDPALENREKLAAVLGEWHAYLRGVEPGLPFVMDAKALQVSPVLTLVTSLGDLDLMDRVNGVGDFADVWGHSTEADLGALRFRVLDLPALVAAKRAAGRPKDRAQLPELEALLERQRKRAR